MVTCDVRHCLWEKENGIFTCSAKGCLNSASHFETPITPVNTAPVTVTVVNHCLWVNAALVCFDRYDYAICHVKIFQDIGQVLFPF